MILLLEWLSMTFAWIVIFLLLVMVYRLGRRLDDHDRVVTALAKEVLTGEPR